MAADPRLTPVDIIYPSTYNPRETDTERLAVIADSLRYLGFLSPIYVTPIGEIISGHQRYKAATEILGLDEIPVVTLDDVGPKQARALNLMFNTSTNDLPRGVTPKFDEGVAEMARLKQLGPVDDPVPVMSAIAVSVEDLPNTHHAYEPASYNSARTLYKQYGVILPVILGKSGDMVNGIGRVQLARTHGIKSLRCVQVDDDRVKPARALLNQLSMDFRLNDEYRTILRHNANRRTVHGKRNYLGSGFIFQVEKGPAKSFDINNPVHAARWKRAHGRKVIDFGAGLLSETKLLQGAGIDAVPFEPYVTEKGNVVSREKSIDLNAAFLGRLSQGWRPDSVFCSSVLNSVPFIEDRRHVVQILAALCQHGARCYAATLSIKHNGYRSAAGGSQLHEHNAESLTFRFPVEPGVTMTDVATRPKLKKHHTGQELYDLFKTAFGVVEVKGGHSNMLEVRAAEPILDVDALRAAIEFEFDLPYDDGHTMGLVDDAKAAFGSFLKGVSL